MNVVKSKIWPSSGQQQPDKWFQLILQYFVYFFLAFVLWTNATDVCLSIRNLHKYDKVATVEEKISRNNTSQSSLE